MYFIFSRLIELFCCAEEDDRAPEVDLEKGEEGALIGPPHLRDEEPVQRSHGVAGSDLPDLSQACKRLRDEFVDIVGENSRIVYYCGQIEKCPSTQRLHVQGYFRFDVPTAISTVISLFPPRCCQVSIANGNEEQNIAYCSKEESCVGAFFEHGERAKQGKRNDVVVVKELISQGKGMRTVISSVNSYQAMKCAELCLKYLEPGRDFQPEVRWYYGSTGSGKSRKAKEEFPDAWMSGKDLAWFEGYDAHEVVIFDDFRKDYCTFHVLLRLLDRYPYRIENKGGSRQLLARVMIITCPWHPEVLYSSRADEDISQLMRRITSCTLFGNVVPAPVAPVLQGAVSLNFKRR